MLAGIEDRDDVRMAQASGGTSLVDQPATRMRVFDAGADQLDGELAVEHGVVSQVHFAHAAAAEEPRDLVAPNHARLGAPRCDRREGLAGVGRNDRLVISGKEGLDRVAQRGWDACTLVVGLSLPGTTTREFARELDSVGVHGRLDRLQDHSRHRLNR